MIEFFSFFSRSREKVLPQRGMRAFGRLGVAVLVFFLLIAGGIRHAIPAHSVVSPVTAATVAAPVRLIIPRLKIDVSLETVGINAKGEMAVPKNADIPGWYRGGVKPGEQGNAVIAGHKDSVLGLPGVFMHLEKMQPGDLLAIEDASGSIIPFRVTDVQLYDFRTAPREKIFGKADASHLQLITCEGTWLAAHRSYDERLVVFTERAEPGSLSSL